MKKREDLHETPDTEVLAEDTAVLKAVETTHFKRSLVPLDEYASRQGISSDVVEKQGRLGVIQIRKFKGRKFVVDVPAEQLSDFENNGDEQSPGQAVMPRSTTASQLVTAGLVAVSIIVVVTVFWLYMDAKTKLDDLRAEHASIQNINDNLTASNENAKALQEELAGSKAELAQIQSRIALSKNELERVQADLNKARRNLDTVQSQLSGVQGQISLSRVEIESIQNGLNESRGNLNGLHRQNAEPNAAPQAQ